jgi:Arc/MetJ-type ribon-helix-helix transcriptional regulator
MADAVMSVEARFPERLLDEAKALVKEGWFQDLDSVLQEALRRYLDAHRSELLDRLVREDYSLGPRWKGLSRLRESSATLAPSSTSTKSTLSAC